MNFIEEFKKKGYFYQCTNLEELGTKASREKLVAYVGFDCTAKSLHVGNLMQVMIMRLFQQCGHKPIILVGGATTKIGDPTGKEELRKYLSDDVIAENIAGIKKSLSKFITFEETYNPNSTSAFMVDNSEWLDKIGYVDFLRDFGKMVSVNKMLTMDSVRLRLQREQSLTFLEFNYMLLQSYDFFYLNQNYGCNLQFGGSDQWGNIIMGVDLVRKKASSEVFGLTTPLLTTSSGAKMGKSVNGAIWLNEDMLSAYDYFQYWRNIDDADLIRFANLYAEMQDEELKNLEELDINEAKKLLAYKITVLCHGKEAADSALETSVNVFEKGAIDTNLPSFDIENFEMVKGVPVLELLIRAGLCSSKGEARRLIQGGGARINDVQISDENMVIDLENSKDGYIKLSSGKKNHILVRIID